MTNKEYEVSAHLVGTHSLEVKRQSKEMFEKYRSTRDPAYFAISADGRSTGWSHCRGGADRCGEEKDSRAVALGNCEKFARKPCKLFAREWDIIWKGPVTYTGGIYRRSDEGTRFSPVIVRDGMNPALRGMSLKKVCSVAVDYSSKPYNWSKSLAAADYIAEANGRNVSIYQCAFETDHQ